MFAEAIEDILRDQATPAVVRAIEDGGDPSSLWQPLADAGFLELLAPEDAGGAGLALADWFPVLTLLGRHALPLPAAQAMAARALVAPGTALPAGLLTIAPVLQRDAAGAWCCPLLPHGRTAQHVLAADGDTLRLLDASRATRTPTGVAWSLDATLLWPVGDDGTVLPGDASALSALGAAVHAALLAGALERVFDMTLQHCNDRVQFGKSLGKFQAVQHQLSAMAEQVAAASIAAETAFQGAARVPGRTAAAIAKARTSEAAVPVANAAHALHGAIGITREYDLQLLTRRLHAWRMAHGSEAYWHDVLGRQVLASDLRVAEFVRLA